PGVFLRPAQRPLAAMRRTAPCNGRMARPVGKYFPANGTPPWSARQAGNDDCCAYWRRRNEVVIGHRVAARSMVDAAHRSFVRRHPVWTGLVLFLTLALIALVVLLANLHWLRGPFQRAVSANLHREVTIGDVRLVRLSTRLTIQLNEVV